MMALRAQQRFRRALILFVTALRKQSRMFSTPPSDQHLAFLAHENNTIFRVKVAVLFQFSRPVTQQSAVVPMQSDRRHIAASWELIMNHGSHRHRFLEHWRGTCRHAFWRAEIEGGEDRG